MSENLLERIQDYIDQHGLFSRSDRLLVALSGGPDSVVLLHALLRLGYAVGAAHLDHGWRDASAREAEQVLAWCRGWGVPCVARRVDLSRFASAEEAAREARYVFLNQVAAQEGYDAIALGHHGDDQAETMLFRLARGTGPAGLAGMRPRRLQASGLALVRPLLFLTREEIEAALADWALPALDDPTNRDERLARNRIRHRVLPELRAINPQAARHIARASDLIAEEEALREEETRRLANHMVRFVAPAIAEVERGALLALPLAVQRRVLRWTVERLGGGWDHAALASALAVAQAGSAADIAGGWHALVAGRFLVVRRGWQAPAARALVPACDQPTGPWGWRVRLTHQASDQAASPVVVRFDAAAMPDDLVWRTARPDTDRFRPWGQRETHSLRHFLTRSQVARHHHETLLVLASQAEIYWVVGVRRGGQAPIQRTPENVWEMQATAAFAV